MDKISISPVDIAVAIKFLSTLLAEPSSSSFDWQITNEKITDMKKILTNIRFDIVNLNIYLSITIQLLMQWIDIYCTDSTYENTKDYYHSELQQERVKVLSLHISNFFFF